MFEEVADSRLRLVIISTVTESLVESGRSVLAQLMRTRVIEGLDQTAIRKFLLKLLRDRNGIPIIRGSVTAIDDNLISGCQCENWN